MTPTQYKQLKELNHENLRDHMTDHELIFSMLGEASTTEIAREKDAQGFDENCSAAKAGGRVAGNARRDLESQTGKKLPLNRIIWSSHKRKSKEQRETQSDFNIKDHFGEVNKMVSY